MIIRALDQLVCKFLCFFGGIILLFALFIKAMYKFDDSPYFTLPNWLDILVILLCLLFYFALFHFAQRIESIHISILWAVFGILAIAYILLVPLIPFSDMHFVDYGAKQIAHGNIDKILSDSYLQFVMKNLNVSLFYGIFLRLLPATTFSIKCVNVICYLLSIHLISKISVSFNCKYPKTVFILSGTFLPVLLYCNHVYFDMPTLCLCILGIFFYTKKKSNLVISFLFLGFACSLRILAYLFVFVIVFDYLCKNIRTIFEKGFIKLLVFFASVVLAVGIPVTVNAYVNQTFRGAEVTNESIWTRFCMGINEEEFGFMHNELQGEEKSFQDFRDLLFSRNLEQNINLFSRKIFWTWSQGTYQAERYGFGSNAVSYEEKFEYETFATRRLMSNEQTLRRVANSVCRAEYLILFGLMIVGMWNLDATGREKFRIFYYIMFVTFVILIFYEMKSRYIFSLIPGMLILAMQGADIVHEKLKRNRPAARPKSLDSK